MTEKPKLGGVRAYARHRGLKSDNAVRKALTSGRIVYHDIAKKLIDFDAADKAWSSNTDPAQQRKTNPAGGKSASAPAGRAPKRADAAGASSAARSGGDDTGAERGPTGRGGADKSKAGKTPADADHAVSEDALGLANEILRRHGRVASGGGFTMVDARTAETLQKMEDRQIDMDKKRGLLVNKAKVLEQIFALARSERDAWLQWVIRSVPKMAAELKRAGHPVDAHVLEVALNAHVRSHLDSLAEVKLSV